MSFALTLPQQKDMVRYWALTPQSFAETRLLAPDGTRVSCQLIESRYHCPTNRAGTYSLQIVNNYPLASDSALSVSYLALLSAACESVSAADSRLGAPRVIQGQVPIGSTDCYTLSLAANDMLRATVHEGHLVSTDIYDGDGNKLCVPPNYSYFDCKLTGAAPFRVVTSGSEYPYKLTFARLSKPEGCPVVEPQVFGTSPDLSSTVPCRLMRATESARYTFGPVVTEQYYAPLGQLLSSGGTLVHDDCGYGSCDLTTGDYTWVNYTQVLDSSPFGMAFHSSKEIRGCTATHDNGLAAGPVKAVFAAPGQRLCLTLPTATGNGVYLLNPSAPNGLHVAVNDAEGKEQCELNGRYGATSVTCRLTGTAPFRAVLTGTAGSSYGLTVHRTGEHTGCAAWPRTGFDGSAGAQVAATKHACLSIPADQHSTAEMVDRVDTDGRRGLVQMFDPSGTAACTGGGPVSCRLTPGVSYTALLESAGMYSVKLARRDVSSAATCTATASTKVGGPSTPIMLGTPLDARCLRVSGAATDKFWLGDRMAGRYLKDVTSTWLTVLDADGKLLCQQVNSLSCKVTGSTSYTVVLSAHLYTDQPVSSVMDIWKVGTVAGWAPECTANPVSVDGFALRGGVLSETSTAHCTVVDMKPGESFYVTGFTANADKNTPAPAVSLHNGREWDSADPLYGCRQQWDQFSAYCEADRDAEPSQALLMLSAGRTPTPAVYGMRAACGQCYVPEIEAATSISPSTSAANTQTQAVVRGTSFTLKTRMKLARDGSDQQSLLTPLSVNTDGTELTVQVDTKGLEPGAYDLVLDGVGYTSGVPSRGYLPKAYTVTAPAPAPKGSRFVPHGPSRFLDTRDGTGATKQRVGPGGVVTLQVAGVKGIPVSGVTAVVMNVTAVQPTEAGHVMVYPNGQATPKVSNLNFAPGQIVPNLVTVPVVNGKIDLRNNAGSVDLIADVTGYYTDPSGAGSALNPITPSRFLDTRDGTGATKQRVGPGGVVTLQVAGMKGIPATGVTAVVMNVTAVQPTEAGHVTVYPNGQAAPGVSNLNFTPGQIVPNLVTVPVVNGKVDLRNNSGSVDLIADVTGYYAATGSAFSAAGPVRLLDTRDGTGARAGVVGPGGSVSLQVTGVSGVPAQGVTAVVLNVTVTNPTEASHIIVHPHGIGRPGVSNLNYTGGQTVANLVVVPVVDGRVTFFNNSGAVDVIADLNGYFTS
ncbi:hypothetical protein [Streptomyces virginiae]|uniref:hypothetical protein n=1 Tax=Streptomyces virginiae TaxID=1961 RepID=UPI00343D843D